MAEQESPTWGSMIWGATKIVGLVAATALVLPPALGALGSALGPAGGAAATGFLENAGEALASGAQKLSNLNSTVVGSVFGESAVAGVDFTKFTGLTELASRAGTGIANGATAVGNAIVANPLPAAAVATGGLAVGYMLRGAERPAPRPQRVSSAPASAGRFVEAEMARRQMAALAAQQGRA
jgi:hypothetical protein